MVDWRRVGTAAGVAAAGLAAGYVAERALLRPRLVASRIGPPLGDVGGELAAVDGPDGVVLAVETYGPADGQEVVFCHGFSLTGRVWHEQVVALSDRFRLVTYDQPGHGRSSPPVHGSYSLDLLADALAAIVTHATDPGRGRVVLVGHSMGGMTALAFARRHPELFAARVGGLLLLSTTAKSGAEDAAVGIGIQALLRTRALIEAGAGRAGPRVHRLARAYRASSDLSFALTRAVGLVRTADPRYVDLTEQLVIDTELDTVAKLTPVLLSMDEEATLATIDVPTVVVGGTDDRLTPIGYARWMARVNPDVELLELPGIGHMTPLEAAHTVNALTVRLAAVARGAPWRAA